MRKGIGGHTKPNRGLTDTWLTPPEIVRDLGRFDLDPCTPDVMPWATAGTMFTQHEDGLTARWSGRVWLNPPYSDAAAWLARLADHGNGIAIVFARTETGMFFQHVWERADALLFIQGRLHFHKVDGSRAKGNAGGPSVLVAYGENNAESLRTCGIAGRFVSLRGV